MCSVCGCGEGETRIEGQAHSHDHEHEHSHAHDHHHDHHHHGADGQSQNRMVRIEQDILAKNNEFAAANRRRFNDSGILALNLVSSPGSGKTMLLVETIKALKGELELAVIEGDQQTARDADLVRATGVPAIQINTGKGCHLDGHMVGHALDSLKPGPASVLFIENVGNLVCPAAFDLGEAHRVAILSVTEGEDKPIKYPDMFHSADLMLLSKIDLLPHVDFDVGRCIDYARQVNPGIKVLQLSAKTGDGMDAWCGWIGATRALALTGHADIQHAAAE